jgi:RNA-splicing ligase RtcB
MGVANDPSKAREVDVTERSVEQANKRPSEMGSKRYLIIEQINAFIVQIATEGHAALRKLSRRDISAAEAGRMKPRGWMQTH